MNVAKQNLGARIQIRLDAIGKGQQWLANRVCAMFPDAEPLTIGTLSALIGRNSKTTTFAARIAAALEVNVEWLTDGTLPMEKNEVAPDGSGPAIPQDERRIPFYDARGSMGGGLLLRDQSGVIRNLNVSSEWINKNVKNCTSIENLCVVTGFGDSMRPMFNSGDPLLLDSGVKQLDYDAVYFFRVGDEGFIKRLQRIPGDGIRAISENKGYESWTIKPDMDFEIFGRIVKVWCSEDF